MAQEHVAIATAELPQLCKLFQMSPKNGREEAVQHDFFSKIKHQAQAYFKDNYEEECTYNLRYSMVEFCQQAFYFLLGSEAGVKMKDEREMYF